MSLLLHLGCSIFFCCPLWGLSFFCFDCCFDFCWEHSVEGHESHPVVNTWVSGFPQNVTSEPHPIMPNNLPNNCNVFKNQENEKYSQSSLHRIIWRQLNEMKKNPQPPKIGLLFVGHTLETLLIRDIGLVLIIGTTPWLEILGDIGLGTLIIGDIVSCWINWITSGGISTW